MTNPQPLNETFAPKSNAPHLDEHGREIPDPTPIAPPLGYKKQPSLAEQIRAMVRSEALRQAAEAAGAESFEEAEDFDVDEDMEPHTPYEAVFDPPAPERMPTPLEEAIKKAGAGAPPEAPPAPPAPPSPSTST